MFGILLYRYLISVMRECQDHRITHFSSVFPKQLHYNFQVFVVKLANRPFLVFNFRALWRSGLSARVPKACLASSSNRRTRARLWNVWNVDESTGRTWNVWRQLSSILGNESSGRTRREYWPYQMRVLAVPYDSSILGNESSGRALVPDDSSSRKVWLMQCLTSAMLNSWKLEFWPYPMRVLAVPDERSGRTLWEF